LLQIYNKYIFFYGKKDYSFITYLNHSPPTHKGNWRQCVQAMRAVGCNTSGYNVFNLLKIKGVRLHRGGCPQSAGSTVGTATAGVSAVAQAQRATRVSD